MYVTSLGLDVLLSIIGLLRIVFWLRQRINIRIVSWLRNNMLDLSWTGVPVGNLIYVYCNG
jgi:hypothetical protein